MQQYPVHTVAFWRAYLVHMRPYLLFVSGAAGWTGMVLAGGLEAEPVRFVTAFLCFLLSYGFGQALTDCFQTDTDRLSAAYRPLSQGTVSIRAVAIVSLVALIITGGVLLSLNAWNLPLVILSIAGLATYSYVKKRFWLAGPFYNAWIVMLLPLMGFLSVSRESLASGVQTGGGELVALLLLSFFAYANFVLMGYLKDITADRQTGYNTFPVKWGYVPTVWLGDIFALAAISFCVLTVGDSRIGWLFLAAGSVVAVAGQAYAHFTNDRSEENAAFPIAATVRGFLLWHLAVVAAHWETGWLFASVFYALFEFTLSRRPERRQI